ncbi:MAG: hypothetical protein EOP83_03605 [Verrucomicrobiaceae bacterium]|nr:MAG: hypothetical protein EOP83_03605 [Verrucomicrobiaceae bacterium]
MHENPAALTCGFFGVLILILAAPIVIHVTTHSQALWIDVTGPLLMGVAGLIRAYWLVRACHTYKRDSDVTSGE